MRKFKNLRRGKKSSITTRVEQIRLLISERGSRTKVSGLMRLLLEVYENTKADNEEVLALNDYAEEDTEWINEVGLTVDNCRVEVDEYIESRKNDDSSPTPSNAASWVQELKSPGLKTAIPP